MLFAANCGNIIRRYCFAAEYALVAQPVEHLTFNQRARDSSSLERTKIPRRIARFLVGFSFYTPFARSLHGFCTVRIFRVRWSKSVNYSAIRAIFCNSGQQSQAELSFYGRVCVLQKLQQCRHGDGRFCFNRGSLHRCCSRLVEAFLELFTYNILKRVFGNLIFKFCLENFLHQYESIGPFWNTILDKKKNGKVHNRTLPFWGMLHSSTVLFVLVYYFITAFSNV